MGHYISLALTSLLMVAVGAMLFRAARRGPRSRVKSPARRYGPFLLLCAAAPLILADIVRHVSQDVGWWPGCGNNAVFSRANSSDPFPDSCRWSSSQYRCNHVCCVPTWLPVPAPGNASVPQAFAWFPPQDTFFPEGGASAPGGEFATLRGDGSVFLPPGFERDPAREPYRVFEAPLAFLGSGERWTEPAHSPACTFGRNPATGACLLADPALPLADQLAQLPRRDPSLPVSADNAPRCACDSCTDVEAMSRLSPVGVLFTICFTYAGFALLATAVLWNANIGAKCGELRREWEHLRRRAAGSGAGGPV
mmetsp:Transcript_28962/g.84883  ORF Transcript_28962/g.84883 Transcript_28962/m.84883 type:complete len:309 (-) Transcript_28962:305-1231(-)